MTCLHSVPSPIHQVDKNDDINSTISGIGDASHHPGSDIMQFDGNDSLDFLRTDGSDSVQIMPEEDNPVSAPGSHDLRYNYTVNPQNQARRLVTSALESPLTVTSNHFEIVDNISYAFNVKVECNSGVYLTAIKPVPQTSQY